MKLIADGRHWPTVNTTFLVRDRLSLTKQTLDSFKAACVPANVSGNVTILDDRSGPETSAFLKSWAEGMHCRIVRNDEPLGTGELRNLVINECRKHWTGYQSGEYLNILDNDIYIPSGKSLWVETLVRCYEFAWNLGFRVLGAYNHPFHQPIAMTYMPDAHAIHELTALATQSMLMRWEVWDTYGPFCQTPVDKVCQSEDVDFTNRIRAAGFKIGVVSPALIASTGITNTFGEHIPGWELVKKQAPPGVIVE